MRNRLLLATAALTVFLGTMTAQNMTRKMTAVGGGAPDRGKCTVEVVVDGAAEVELRGDTATLRNLSGASPQWRRFECTGPLPSNPANFRFSGVDGRGRQQLIHDTRSGGSALVRLDDPDNGSEAYTFDIFWGNAAPPPFQSQNQNQAPRQGQGQPQARPNDRGFDGQAPVQGQARPDERGFDRQGPGPGRPDERGFDRQNERGGEPRPGYGQDQDSFHTDRDNAFRGDGWRMRLFARVREDLDHVQGVAFPSSGDQYRMARVRRELDQLQRMQAQGRYDRRQLDDVVRALSAVVADNRLFPRDRDLLNDDLRRLQDFRARTSEFGVR